MEAEARYTWVGTAVIGPLAAMMAALVWLKNSGDENVFKHHTIHFERQSGERAGRAAAATALSQAVGQVFDELLPGLEGGLERATVKPGP